MDDFTWMDPGTLSDRDLELVLAARCPADPARNYVPVYKFAMYRTDHPRPVGHIDLRVGHTRRIEMYGGHIAYGVDPEHRGHRFAARACRLLLPLARRHGVNPVWITCNPDNPASRRTAELAGGTLVGTVDLPVDIDMYLEGERQKCRYRIDL